MKRRIIWIAIFFILVITSMLIALRCNSNAAATTFQMSEISRGDVINMVSCSGTLEAVGTVEVGTQISGVLDHIYVDFNDKVKKNQIVAVLDTIMLKTQVMDAEANHEKAMAQLDEAEANYDRNLLLYQDGLISDAEFLPFKINQHCYPDEDHEAKDSIVTEAPLEFRHKMEIHSVHT